MSIDVSAEIQTELSDLDAEAQRRLLNYIRSLKRRTRGTAGSVIAGFAGAIPAEDLKQMEEAIGKGCEKVDLTEW